MSGIEFNTTHTYVIEDFAFSGLSQEAIIEIMKDGRAFSHFIEPWLPTKYPSLKHIKGCKKYDHIDDQELQYDEKTFTHGGCKFCPSNMLGQGRVFNEAVFLEKSKNLIYIIVSNIEFPKIRVRFVRGDELAVQYPKGIIPLKDFDKFFA